MKDVLVSYELASNNCNSYITNVNNFYPSSITTGTQVDNLTWEKGRLTSFNDVTFEYNVNGIRTKKIVGTTQKVIHTYKLEGTKIIKEYIEEQINNKNIAFEYIYDEQDILVGVKVDDEVYYYDRNIMGEITGIIDSSGNYMIKYFYNAYGKVQVEPLSVTNISIYNSFLYKGYYYDFETELFYCNSRYYSPEICRFISLDRIEYLDPQSINGLNLYCYCMNNPVNYSDVSGHAPEWLGWAFTGLTLVGLTALTVLSLGTAAPITGVAAGIIISATCGAYAGAITSVISQGISNGWDNISSWDVLKQTAIGTFTGAISGLSAGLGTTVITGGLSQVISGLFDGSIDTFSDGLVHFALGGIFAGMTYGFSNIVSNKLAVSKISKIIGNSNKNAVINKRLAAAGFKNLKVGVVGMGGVVNHLYKYYGFEALNSLISGIAGGAISLIGGII